MKDAEQIKQAHCTAAARLRKIDETIERAAHQVSEGAIQSAQQSLGEALAAIALGEQLGEDVETLRENLRRAKLDYADAKEEAGLRMAVLQRLREEALWQVQEIDEQLLTITNAARRAVMDAMKQEIAAVSPSWSPGRRHDEFGRIAKTYGLHILEVQERWNNRSATNTRGRVPAYHGVR